MIKYLLGLIIAAASTITGKRSTDRYKKRYEFFNSLSSFNSDVIRDMAYKKNGILSLMQKSYGNAPFDEYLAKIEKSIREETGLPEVPYFLEREDGEFVSGYFSEIGKFSSASETDFLAAAREELAARTEERREKAKKYSSLGAKLGFAVGMTVFIIIR